MGGVRLRASISYRSRRLRRRTELSSATSSGQPMRRVRALRGFEPCLGYLVDHPKGLLLVATGMGCGAGHLPRPRVLSGPHRGVSLPAFGAIGVITTGLFLTSAGCAIRAAGVLRRWTGWSAHAVAIVTMLAVPSIYMGSDVLEAKVAEGSTAPGRAPARQRPEPGRRRPPSPGGWATTLAGSRWQRGTQPTEACRGCRARFWAWPMSGVVAPGWVSGAPLRAPRATGRVEGAVA
jgi:hypothetical protein